MVDRGRNVKRLGALAAIGILLLLLGRCARRSGVEIEVAPKGVASLDAGRTGLHAPLAAAQVGNGDVLVAAVDPATRSIHVQRIDAKDVMTLDRVVLTDVTLTADADLKLAASADGAALTWRGMRGGKLVRQLVMLGPDLAPRGDPIEVPASSCATREAVWTRDDSRAMSHQFSGPAAKVDLPKDKDASLLCGPHRTFAVIEEEEKTSILPLGTTGAPTTMLRESDFGEDEQRELSEYTVGDDVGIVRLAASGALALRELRGGSVGPLQRLTTKIGKDDDVVAVDASTRFVAIIYIQDISNEGDADVQHGACTKVLAIKIDRKTFEETRLELYPGRCGHEVGPFFTSALGESVSVAWPERSGGAGRPRAPVVALAHTVLGPDAATSALTRTEQSADALVDATCDATRCYAVALEEGAARVLRYK